MRRGLYDRGLLRSWRPPVPCISVGNISWGGSGKTPLCSWLLKWCLEQGLTPALLTRGYKASPPHLPYRVGPESPVDEAGDEPLMLARSCPGSAHIVVDPRRTRGGRWIFEAESPGACLLDDGFQHLAVQRDIDLVLLRPADLGHEWSAVLPSGSWREGADALRRADAFLVNAQPDEVDRLLPEIEARLSPLGRPVFCFSLQIRDLLRVVDQKPVSGLSARDCLLVSGVGSPESVESSARTFLGAAVREHLRFADHRSYTARDWAFMVDRASALGCSTILCTTKDAVKLERFADARLISLTPSLVFADSCHRSGDFASWLAAALSSCS